MLRKCVLDFTRGDTTTINILPLNHDTLTCKVKGFSSAKPNSPVILLRDRTRHRQHPYLRREQRSSPLDHRGQDGQAHGRHGEYSPTV